MFESQAKALFEMLHLWEEFQQFIWGQTYAIIEEQKYYYIHDIANFLNTKLNGRELFWD